jgi:hypothetical protein
MNSCNALQALRRRLLFLDGISDERSPAILQLVAKRDVQIEKTLNEQILDPHSPSCGSLWGDLGEWKFERYSGWWGLGTLLEIARGWADERSAHFHSERISAAIEAAVHYIAPMLRVDPARRNGFYFWDIYHNEAVAHLLVLCGDGLSPEVRKILTDFLETVPSQAFRVSREQGVLKPLQSGSNMLDVLYGLMLRGAALDDEQWVKASVAQLPIAMGKDPGGEGIQNDWSYHFHGRGVNVGYGMNDISVRARWFFLLQGTPWQLGEELQQEYAGLIREFFRYNFWRGRVSPYAIDRGIATPDGVFAGCKMYDVFALALLAGFAEPDQQMLAATARQCLPQEPPDLYRATLRARVAAQIERAAPQYTALRFYPESDYLLARQNDWFAAIRMCSLRTKAWDTQNRMHVQGSSSGEFSIALMTDGSEFDNATIATMKWNRLMNVTRCDTIEAPPMSYGQSTFVGGLAEENALGVLAMQYLLAPPGQETLTANKSVFVTPEAMVILGNRIRCNSGEPVVTTLFHAPLEEGAVYRRDGEKLNTDIDGQWELQAGTVLLLRNVAIRLLHPAMLSIETREGNYAALNDPEYSEAQGEKFQKTYRRRWVYLEVHHGARPDNGAYGAVLWPAVAPDFSPPHLKISQTDSHHRLDLADGRGAEVRFPIDWRARAGLSYSGAEPFKWGSIARWEPGADAAHFELSLLAPRRYAAVSSSSTELVLPDGFVFENVTLMSMTGKPFPDNLLSTTADGEVKTMTVFKHS